MPRLIAWFVHNPIASNLMMWVLIVVGAVAFSNTFREEFPNMTVDVINIGVPYPGASPAEIEESICIRIEEAVEGTPGVKRMNTAAVEGRCRARAELHTGTDKGRVLDEIKSKVEAIDSFPAESEQPEISEPAVLTNVFQIAVYGPTDERSLKELGWQMRDDMVNLPNVSQVAVKYIRPYEISIEVSETTLRRYGLSLRQISDAIRQSSLDLPGGAIKTRDGEILLRTNNHAHSRQEYEAIVVLTQADGSVVRLGDIATVVDGFKDNDMRMRFDGQPAIMLDVRRIGAEDVLQIAEEVEGYLDEKIPQLPEGLAVTVWKDEAEDIDKRLRVLRQSAAMGLVLVLMVLALFLKPALAFWVAVGIPVALMGSLILFPPFAISINSLSVMAIILVLGILVDDAVVVSERIYVHQLSGMDPAKAAIQGTQDVSLPVIFGVLTTMTAFLPFIFIPGPMGQWFGILGYVVIFALLFSIVESQLILPQHLSHGITKGADKEQPSWLAKKLQEFAASSYRNALDKVIEWRYLALAVAVAALILIVGLLASGRLVIQFFPSVVGTRMYANLTMPAGTGVDTMEAKVQQIERAAFQLREELDADLAEGEPSRITHFISSIGEGLAKGSIGSTSRDGSHYAEVGLEIIEANEDELDPRKIVKRWRELTGPIPGAVELTFDANAYSAGKAVNIQLRGNNLDELKVAAAAVKEKLRSYPGVFDISDTFRAGKQELKINIKADAQSLGLSSEQIARQVREAFYGIEVQRIQRNKDDVRVMVRFPDSERRSVGDLESMLIRTPNGSEVPFSSVATLEQGRGFSSIQRIDGARVITVEADVDRGVIAPEVVIGSVVSDLLPKLQQELPSVSYNLGGEAEERLTTMNKLMRDVSIAFIVIFVLLAIPLKSYLQPLIIMSVIPFGLLGAILGHLIMDMDLQIFSLLGIIALAGVVVNSSLVLVDYINRERDAGTDVRLATLNAGQARFRPIILTSITTFVGLIPLVFNDDLSLLMFRPLATSLSFGIITATALTLLLVPALYMVLEDWNEQWQEIKQSLAKALGRNEVSE